jgi:transcriptional regulator GlxA family with amidase domain
MATTKIVFLLLPHIHLLDLAGADQVFHEAIEQGADIALDYCSFTENIISSTSLPFGKLKHFSKIKIKEGDYIFVPGAEVNFLVSKKMKAQKDLFGWINVCYKKGANICSICTGAFFLAEAGLLNGRKCTTHWKRTNELQTTFPAIRLVENILYTEDERIFTSAGVTAGIDMALNILSKLKDDNFSFKVARELVIYVRRQGNELQQSVFMQYRNHIHTGIHNVQEYLQENCTKKSNLNELADIAFMSIRNLTRTFKKETGLSINEYITLIRKERIKELIKNPNITRAQLAVQCGLKSERHVARLLQPI